MSKNEILDKYWLDFLKWCVNPPSEKPSDLVFWLDKRYPTDENFWEWLIRFNSEALKI